MGVFLNQAFDWTVMPEGGTTLVVTRTLEELRLTFKANEGPLEKWPGTLSGCVVHSSLSREGMKVTFLKVGKKEHKDMTGTSRTSGKQVVQENPDSRSAAWLLCPGRPTKCQPNVTCVSSSKVDLNIFFKNHM